MIWKAIPAWPEYEISDEGDVRRRLPGRSQRVGRPVKWDRGRYARVTLFRDGTTKKLSVNRLVLETFVGPPPSSEHQAAHDDGDPFNNRLANLQWKTPVENMADKIRHGTMPSGERSPRAKLTWPKVRRIRELVASGHQHRSIAAQFGVAHSLISRIARRETWVE